MQHLKPISIGLLTLVVFSQSSCALVFQGTRKDVEVVCKTPGASIYIDDYYMGKEEVVAGLRRKRDHYIEIKKEGCITKEVNIHRKLQAGWIVADVLFHWYGAAPLADGLTGAWYTFDKDYINTSLHCPDADSTDKD
ncbi:MAG: hypothetical protein EOP56_02265 [Sphingobacteriales bacterium]|nr:MAG: hypothetical protein EOP56_02265 [Sphingobacteriales bacterium]